MWGFLCEIDNDIAVLISPLAPDSRDHSGFYGLYGVCPAALLFKRRQTGIVFEREWQKCLPVQAATVYKQGIISDSIVTKYSFHSSLITTDWPWIIVV